jgi:hypothetical protein
MSRALFFEPLVHGGAGEMYRGRTYVVPQSWLHSLTAAALRLSM